MEFAQLEARVRNPDGKGPARRLRAQGAIPAVCYGRGMPSTPLSVSPVDLFKILKGEHGRNTVIQLKVDANGTTQDLLVMLRDFQSHPINRQLLHADFIQVKLDEEILVEVPLITVGRPAGVQKGGILNQVFRRLPLRCRPDRIPIQVSIDVTELDMGDGLTVAKVTGLPEGVRIALDSNQTIVSVTAPEKEPTPEEVAAAEGVVAPVEGAALTAEGAPAAPGTVAAPTAGAKPAPGAKPAAAAAEKKEEKGAKKERK